MVGNITVAYGGEGRYLLSWGNRKAPYCYDAYKRWTKTS